MHPSPSATSASDWLCGCRVSEARCHAMSSLLISIYPTDKNECVVSFERVRFPPAWVFLSFLETFKQLSRFCPVGFNPPTSCCLSFIGDFKVNITRVTLPSICTPWKNMVAFFKWLHCHYITGHSYFFYWYNLILNVYFFKKKGQIWARCGDTCL